MKVVDINYINYRRRGVTFMSTRLHPSSTTTGIYTGFMILRPWFGMSWLSLDIHKYQRRQKYIERSLRELLGGPVSVQTMGIDARGTITLVFDFPNYKHNEAEVPITPDSWVGCRLEKEIHTIMQRALGAALEISRFYVSFSPFK
jgi:hypothetical protein